MLFRLNAYQFPIAMTLDAKQIPHSAVNSNHLFRTWIGRDVYSYLSVILHPRDASAKAYEVILKRPNKFFTNAIIDSVTDWTTFCNAPEQQGLRAWEREKLSDFFHRIEKLRHLSKQSGATPHSLLTQLDVEIGLGAFYRNQSRLSVELDDASDEILFEVIVSVAKNFDRLDAFYQYVCRAIENESSATAGEEQSNRNEVVLTTIHKTKGNEYRNVVYFNLSQDSRLVGESDIEEERRVTYVGVTRARESIYVTALSNKPSVFLRGVALNADLKSLPSVKLESEINAAYRELMKLQHQIDIKQSEKNHLLAKYPELNGKHVDRSYSLWMNLLSWWREKRIEAASRRIDLLETEIGQLTHDRVKPRRERMKYLESEIQIRRKILGDRDAGYSG